MSKGYPMAWMKSDDAKIPESIRGSVKRARAKAPPPPGRDPVIVYLKATYREISKWFEGDDNVHDEIVSFYQKTLHGRTNRSYARVLIELSAPPHVSPQEKSKYVNVLRYAYRRKVRPDNFEEFVAKNGGIKGCIRQAEKVKK
jgi:hypothetical protein